MSRIRRAFLFGSCLPISHRLCLGKRCGANQFFVRSFRCARFRNAHSGGGGINDHGFVSPGPKRRGKVQAEEEKARGFGRRDSDSRFWCSRLRSARAADGILTYALVVCDDRRGLYSQHAADLASFLSDASVAAAHRRRQRNIDAPVEGGHTDPKNRTRQLALCRCARIWVGAGRSSRDRGADASGSGRDCLQNGGSEIFYEPPADVCRVDFDCGSGRRLCLFAVCGVAHPGH